MPDHTNCDDTKLDLLVIDPETRLPLGRPWLTTMIDVCTKMITGFYLGFHPPGYLNVMRRSVERKMRKEKRCLRLESLCHRQGCSAAPAPYSGESFPRFLLRLAEENSYDSMGWIPERAGLKLSPYARKADQVMLEKHL